MTGNNHTGRLRPSVIGEAWQAFWFRPEPMYTFGLVRIGFGAIAVVWTLWLLPIRHDLLDPDGVVPSPPSIRYTWSIFEVWPTDQAILIGWAVLLAAAIALTVGWHSRLAAVAVVVLILSFQRLDPWIFNAGDIVVRLEALFLALGPCGAALSLDQRRRTGSFWSAQSRPIWPVRLLQVQLSIIYLASVQVKLSGQTWLQGTAVSYALRLEDMQRLSAPHWATTNALIMNAATWGALAIELAVGVLVWSRRFRPWVLAAGVMLHLVIDTHIEIGIFSYSMLVLYLAWISPDTVQRLPDALKQAAAKSLAILRRHNPPDSPPVPVGHRINGQEQRPSEQISTSASPNMADAGYGHAHPTSEVNGHGNLDESPGGNNAEISIFRDKPEMAPGDVSRSHLG
jgi:hypothetical protein